MAERSIQAKPIDPARAERLARANINPATGLASDYLNHFSEAVMLLDMLADCPECIADIRAWKRKSYCEHFADSRFKDRAVAIEAYGSADPAARHSLETLADTMTSILEATRDAMGDDPPDGAALRLAVTSANVLKPLVARAGAIINGTTDAQSVKPAEPQAAVDQLMER